jgi:hypothetical protein
MGHQQMTIICMDTRAAFVVELECEVCSGPFSIFVFAHLTFCQVGDGWVFECGGMRRPIPYQDDTDLTLAPEENDFESEGKFGFVNRTTSCDCG